MARAVAAAPCNVGVGGDPNGFVGPDRLVAATADAGYAGLDLGPPGYLDAGFGLADRLKRSGLGISGAWVTIAQPNTLDVLDFLLEACDTATRLFGDLPPPRPTLAAPEPPQARLGAPVYAEGDHWHELIRQINDSAERCRDRGYSPVFHPHVGTLIETPHDTERFLEDTDIDLCFDPGHVALGGGEDVIELSRRWQSRITHLHMKNVRMAVAADLRSARADPQVIWGSGVFAPLDAGDLDLPEILRVLGDVDGWIVIEQDAAVPDPDAAAQALRDQHRNLETLRRWEW